MTVPNVPASTPHSGPSPDPDARHGSDRDEGRDSDLGSRRATHSGHDAPRASTTRAVWNGPDGPLDHTACAEWIVLRERDKPIAEVFSVSYVADAGGPTIETTNDTNPDANLPDDSLGGDGPNDRPVTFVMNGGPGASSVYLHLGAVGPRRVNFAADGSALPPPSRLVDNVESWLAFTDLVFVDPVGTGFSRVIDKGEPREPRSATGPSQDSSQTRPTDGGGDVDPNAPDPRAFFGVERDLDSLGEFMTRWLSLHQRWGSPSVIAGESYGGFRGAKLVRRMAEKFGVGLSGAILISPALEFATLDPSDYDVLAWVDLVPTMATAAVHHGRSRTFDPGTGTADVIGLDPAVVRRARGRIGMQMFARELLRDQGRTLGLYDASTSVRDPFPDRDAFEGPDPSLAGIDGIFGTGINQRLRAELGVEVERPYELISLDVNKRWKTDIDRHALDGPIGAVDDLRHGMALDPSVQVLITHGHFDMVTPLHASDRLRNQMRLDPDTASRIRSRHFDGGHMFYAWEASRVAFRDTVAQFYIDAVTL